MNTLRALFGNEADVLLDRQFQLLLLTLPPLAVGIALLSPILESLTGPFGVSSTAIGQLISAYVAPAIFVIPAAGLFADRYGRKPLLVGGLFLFGIAGTAIAFTTDFQVALGLRFLQGMGSAALSPMIITALGDLYSGPREATAQGIRFMWVGVAQAVVPPIAGLLVIFAWHYPFLLYAVAIPIGFGVWLWFDEPTSLGTGSASNADADPLGGQSQLRALAELSSSPRVLTVIIARQIPTIGWYVLVTYNSILVVQVLGGSPSLAGLLFAASSVGKATAAAQVGRASAFFNRRVDLLIIVHVILGAGLIISGFASSFLWVGVGFVGIGIGLGTTMSLYRSIITSFAPEHLRGSIVSVSETSGKISGTATPVLLGLVVVVLEPMVGGSALAIRWAIAGTGFVGGTIAIVALIIAVRSPAVSAERTID